MFNTRPSWIVAKIGTFFCFNEIVKWVVVLENLGRWCTFFLLWIFFVGSQVWQYSSWYKSWCPKHISASSAQNKIEKNSHSNECVLSHLLFVSSLVSTINGWYILWKTSLIDFFSRSYVFSSFNYIWLFYTAFACAAPVVMFQRQTLLIKKCTTKQLDVCQMSTACQTVLSTICLNAGCFAGCLAAIVLKAVMLAWVNCTWRCGLLWWCV